MDFLTVSPRLGTLIEASGTEAPGLPEFFYANWKDNQEPLTVWWLEGANRVTHTINPGVTFQTTARAMLPRSDLLLSRWPELYLVHFGYASSDLAPRMWAVNVRAGSHESLQLGDEGSISGAFSDPFAHPNGKVYWTARNSIDTRDLVVWDPPAAPVVLTTLDTTGGAMAYHRTPGGDDLLVHFNTTDPTNSYVVDLTSGTTTTVATRSPAIYGLYSFADPEVDSLGGALGGAYGLAPTNGLKLRGSHQHDTLGYGFGSGFFAFVPALNGVLTSSTLRWNASRKALACYHFQSELNSNLKWFDPSQPYDAPVNTDDTLFIDPAPPLDVDDPDSFPDQIYPAAVEPFD